MSREVDATPYAALLEAKGGADAKAALARGERVILGFRVENSTYAALDNPATRRDESRDGTGVYNDRMVVLWKEDRGGVRARVFDRANTEPTAQYDAHAAGRIPRSRRSQGVDVNGDRIKDAGRLSDGVIEMGMDVYQGAPALRPTVAAVAGGRGRIQRDTNGDGRFSEGDPLRLADLDRSFLIHRGSRGNTDSAGCQTIHRDDYPEFLRTVGGMAGQKRWQYVLVTVEPDVLRDFDRTPERSRMDASKDRVGLQEPAHPDHALYSSILGKVHAEDGRRGRVPDACSDNLAGSLTVACRKNGVERAEGFFFNEAGTRAFVVDAAAGTSTRNWASVDVAQAVGQPLHRSEAMLAVLHMDQPQATVQRHNQADPAPQLQVSGQASVPALAATR